MSIHERSAVAFGRFLNQVSEAVLDGAPPAASLELVRRQFGAFAVVLVAEDRARAAEPQHVFAHADAAEAAELGLAAARDPESAPGHRIALLLEHCQHIATSRAGRDGHARYALSIFRPRFAQRFDEDEAALADILLDQLARGLELSLRVGASELERTLYSDITERLYVGVVILDGAGRILRESATASRFLHERDGIQAQAGRLRASCANEDRELQAAIREVLADGPARPASRGLSLTKRTGSRSLGLVVRRIGPAHAGAIGLGAAVVVYIRDPEAHPEVEVDLVRQLFDLTPAEAAVARRLADGLSLEDAAGALDISRNTARAHLRSIFSKSGITRQTELVRLVLNSAVMLGERRCPA